MGVADGENIWRIDIFLHLLCYLHGLKFIKLFEPANDSIENYLLCILHTNQVKKSNCPSLMIVRVSMIKTKYKNNVNEYFIYTIYILIKMPITPLCRYNCFWNCQVEVYAVISR